MSGRGDQGTTSRTEARQFDAQRRTERYSSDEERQFVDRLRAGDEEAFVQLLRKYGPAMLRVAQLYVPSMAIAEEVVQETWVAVLQGIGRFQGRSSLKTWLFKIHIHRALSRGASEGRTIPFSALSRREIDADDRAVDPDRFRRPGDRFANHWTSLPERWADPPESGVLARETISVVERAAAALPPAQRAVIILRDVVDWNAHEVCEVLGITSANQRVLLHRARAKVRKALNAHLAPT